MPKKSKKIAESSASSQTQGTIHIYIDNSNLWIQGQKTYAEKKGLEVAYDPTWRFDVGRLKYVLTKCSDLRSETRTFKVKVHLYGSTPPPVDTVWNALESHDVEVSTFARSTWNGREKEVDMAMGLDCMEQALENKFTGQDSEFIIVSGDRDLYRAVEKIVKYNFPVHVWSWDNALAGEYRKELHDLIKVYLLDKHLEEIGFRESTFRVDRSIINPHSIVVLDPLYRSDEVKSFISNLTIPVHKYECPAQREGATSKDLVIIPTFAWKMKHDGLVDLYQKSKAKLEASGLKVMTYLDYGQKFFQNSATHELAISNQFAELPDPQEEVQGDAANIVEGVSAHNEDQHETSGFNDGFTQVKHSSKQWKKKHEQDEMKGRQHCHWGVYCTKAENCLYGHTKDEQKRFSISGYKKASKWKLCENPKCVRGEKCIFAHSEAKLLCTACDTLGHPREKCPVWSLR